MMPRLAKTYSRNPQRETYAAKAFDDLLKDNRPSTAKAATTGSKWGKTSFTSTRTAVTPTPMEEPVESKKRKVERKVDPNPIDLFDDPFSFEDEGPMKSRKTERRASPLTLGQAQPKAVTKPVPVSSKPAASNSSNRTYEMSNSQEIEDTDDIPVVRKTAIRTYGRANKNGATKTVIKPLGLTASKDNCSQSSSSSSSLGGNNNKIQMSIDNYTQKMPILTISRDRFNRHTVQNSSNSQNDTKPVKKKFFVTSPAKSVDEDHNYSHKEDSDALSSQDTKLFESDYELDSDEELDSGDPEITFNSPKKRRGASLAAPEQLVVEPPIAGPPSDDNDTLPDEDVHRMSPFSMTDEEDEVNEPASSRSRAPPQQRYTSSYSASKQTLTLTKAYSTGTTSRPAAAAASASQSATNATVRTERKPIFTYSRNRGANSSAAATNSLRQSDSRPGVSDSDRLDVARVRSAADSRHVRADSPASVGSASSSASTSSATGNQRSLKLTYSRKSRSDADAKSGLLVRKLLTSPKKVGCFLIYTLLYQCLKISFEIMLSPSKCAVS